MTTSQIIGYGYLIGAVIFFFVYWIEDCYTSGKQGLHSPDNAVLSSMFACLFWPIILAMNIIELIETRAYKAGLAQREKELSDVNKEEGSSNGIG